MSSQLSRDDADGRSETEGVDDTDGRIAEDKVDEVDEQPDPSDLVAQVDLLRAENRRLRQEYTQAKRTQYRRTALGLALVGALATGAAAVFPSAQTVFLVLGGTGLFSAVLTYYLTPERFIAASVGERVYGALADTHAAVTVELGLQDARIYVPTGGDPVARLFVPQYGDHELPDSEELDSVFVASEEERRRGVSFVPTGSALFVEFDRTRTGSLGETPTELADQLVNALVEVFELADGAAVDVDSKDGRATFRVDASAYGSEVRFDHPVVSFLAVGLAVGLSEPVTSEVHDADAADFLVTCRWGSVKSEEAAT
ncbi:hypothetical protein [Halegenticoccus tardaugens]|uniref:hypothetical protein n=1 Tax=Halegenticoccus tardaugens TaxID=2071624 RepID=UPI00100C2026|nr:hypothetical protein [Halegenticoccus tardaugens]